MPYDDLAAELKRTVDELELHVEQARRTLVPVTRRYTVVENGAQNFLKVTREGVGPLQTQFGLFHHFSFKVDDKWKKYSALVKVNTLSDDLAPRFADPTKLLLRIDSGCETGQLFGDQTCECVDQLRAALAKISVVGEGVLINIPGQDGRGLGLPFKLATLRLQSDLFPLDTVHAFTLLDPNAERDVRTYSGALAVLKFLGVTTDAAIQLMSNNPKKIGVFTENGWAEPSMVEIVIPPTEYTKHHLQAKQSVLGHRNLVTNESDSTS